MSDIVILGLSVTSSWGNGHAVTYRALIKGLAAMGHRILFLERNQEWYAGNRDTPKPEGARTELYETLDELMARFERDVAEAKLVIVGSYVPDGIRVAKWVVATARGATAFYDIDTPVTFSALEAGTCGYLTRELVPRFDLYLSFTGGPLLRTLESRCGARAARPLYCLVDPGVHRPDPRECRFDLGYLGTYSDDRQPVLDCLLLEPARRWREGRFLVVGPMYPPGIAWPENVVRQIHLSPREHSIFYGSQRFTLNATRASMKQWGWSPSVRLFEAGACGTPVISDWWDGLDSFFAPGAEILVSAGPEDTMRYLRDLGEPERLAIAAAARARVLSAHTPERRAVEIEGYLQEIGKPL